MSKFRQDRQFGRHYSAFGIFCGIRTFRFFAFRIFCIPSSVFWDSKAALKPPSGDFFR